MCVMYSGNGFPKAKWTEPHNYKKAFRPSLRNRKRPMTGTWSVS
jgi:hypothetical protein